MLKKISLLAGRKGPGDADDSDTAQIKVTAGSKAVRTAPKQARTKTPRLDSIRMLVVDESGTARCGIAGMARSLGGICDVADDLEPALRQVEESRYDILLVDMDMSEGVGLIRTLRRRSDWAAFVPIIGLSGEESSVMAYTARSAGAHHLATKPLAGRAAFARLILGVLANSQRNATEAFGDGDLSITLAKAYGDEVAEEMLKQTRSDLNKGVEMLRDAIQRRDRERMHHAGRFLGGVGRMLHADQFAATALRLKQYNPALVDETPMKVLQLCEAAAQALGAAEEKMASA